MARFDSPAAINDPRKLTDAVRWPILLRQTVVQICTTAQVGALAVRKAPKVLHAGVRTRDRHRSSNAAG